MAKGGPGLPWLGNRCWEMSIDGPLLLQDHYLIEQMANFNRERIPERQPHAKGGGAFGTFEVTEDVTAFTRAAVFAPGTTTEVLSRFSTVAGERGSRFSGGGTMAAAMPSTGLGSSCFCSTTDFFML